MEKELKERHAAELSAPQTDYHAGGDSNPAKKGQKCDSAEVSLITLEISDDNKEKEPPKA
jgi:hypothetical protein